MHKSLKLAAQRNIQILDLIGPPGAGKDYLVGMLSCLYKNRVRVTFVSTSGMIGRYKSLDNELGKNIRENQQRLLERERVVLSNLDDHLMLTMLEQELAMVIERDNPQIIVLNSVRTRGQMAHLGHYRELVLANLTAEVYESLLGAEIRTKDLLSQGKAPRDEDHPDHVRKRYDLQMNDVRATIKIYQQIASRKPLTIERTWSPRKRGTEIVTNLRYATKLARSLEIQKEIISDFDNLDSEVCKYIREKDMVLSAPPQPQIVTPPSNTIIHPANDRILGGIPTSSRHRLSVAHARRALGIGASQPVLSGK